jgi:hypothetical protein
MEDDYFGKAVDDLKAAAGCERGVAQEYQLGRAQVNAILAIATSLDQVVGELVRIRHAQGDWSE